MKLRVVVGVLSLSVLGTWACTEEQQGEADQKKTEEAQKAGEPAKAGEPKAGEQAKAEPAAEAPKPEVTPKQVCEEAAAAAKAKDETKLATYVSGDADAVKDSLTTFLGNANCGEPKVDGDKGQVPVKLGEGKRAKTKELPVVKSADGWKIDAATYLEKNPPKKVKGKKGGKKKGK